MSASEIVIIQHMEWEGPGQHLLAALHGLGAPFRVVKAWQEPIQPVAEIGLLLVLGGSPNVDEEEQFPYLAPLKTRIQEVIAAGKPYLGFCLGHQLLAHVLGCRVGPLPKKSIGFITGELTDAGLAHPSFQGLAPRPVLFKWHGQGVLQPLPPGVSLLARSDAAPVEALGLADNPRVLGLQYDNHVGPADVAQWLTDDQDWVLAGSGADPAAIKAEAYAQEAAMGAEFLCFMDNFLRLAYGR